MTIWYHIKQHNTLVIVVYIVHKNNRGTEGSAKETKIYCGFTVSSENAPNVYQLFQFLFQSLSLTCEVTALSDLKMQITPVYTPPKAN